ncbi:hypothetical protein PXK05_20595 [Phaeobacter gallaeciensis]|jgi:hypothetical protein|uniref:hypothetical protein n=1 Tax=Phaeobacter gallaeciensis TaxID=60890 RepID=UPI00237F8DAB|nr:hypothetical protein [Phaeobacter gallaeciensis]MDE4230844.1 hypothetical protein [Phaeobacter gallaeciensis]
MELGKRLSDRGSAGAEMPGQWLFGQDLPGLQPPSLYGIFDRLGNRYVSGNYGQILNFAFAFCFGFQPLN